MLQSLITRMRRRRADDAQLSLVLPTRPAPATAGELLAVLQSLGLRRIASCRLTRNRSVMVFCGPRDSDELGTRDTCRRLRKRSGPS